MLSMYLCCNEPCRMCSVDSLCINNVTYDLWCFMYLNLDLCRFHIVMLMHPVSGITHMLYILDTYNVGVTPIAFDSRSKVNHLIQICFGLFMVFFQ